MDPVGFLGLMSILGLVVCHEVCFLFFVFSLNLQMLRMFVFLIMDLFVKSLEVGLVLVIIFLLVLASHFYVNFLNSFLHFFKLFFISKFIGLIVKLITQFLILKNQKFIFLLILIFKYFLVHDLN